MAIGLPVTAVDAWWRALDLPEPVPVEREPQRAAVLALASRHPWARLDWPALVEALLALGRTDLPLARLTEGHVDALRILDQAGCCPEPGAVYGVWASRSQATGLTARRTGDGWVVDGTLRFASGAGLLDRALVPGWLTPEHHQLLDVDVSEWSADTSAWRTRAMELSHSHTYRLEEAAVRAVAVGPPDFYLTRPLFFPGGVGVAAVWAGGAAHLLDRLEEAVPAHRRTPAQRARVGQARSELAAAVASCRQAALGFGDPTAVDGFRTQATLCRSAVGAGVRRLLEQVRLVAGSAALAHDEALTRAVDDLALYVAQQSPDADTAFLGEQP